MDEYDSSALYYFFAVESDQKQQEVSNNIIDQECRFLVIDIIKKYVPIRPNKPSV